MRCLIATCVACLLPLCVEAAMVKLTVAEPSGVERTAWPVTSGVPFAQGALTDPNTTALFGPDGKEIPLQTEALARWPDGSVRWLLLDFQLDLAPKESKSLALRYGPAVGRAPVGDPVLVRKTDDVVEIDTGPLRVRRRMVSHHLVDEALMDLNGDGRFIDANESLGASRSSYGLLSAELLRPGGKLGFVVGAAEPATVTVEQSGPLRACVRIEGRHTAHGEPMFRYVLRVHAFRSQPFLRIFYTFVNDQQDALMARLACLRLHLHCGKGMGDDVYSMLGATRKMASESGISHVFQLDENHYEVDAKPSGKRAPGWAAVGAQKAGLAVGLREFWQQWPKRIQCITAFPDQHSGRTATIRVGMCPWLREGLYDGKPTEEESKLTYYLRDGVYTFKVGMAKTHELWATFFKGKPDVKRLSAFFQAAEDPLLATCEPAYVDSTKVLGDLPPADPKKYSGYDAWLSRALDAHLKLRDRVREYGMLNYGDWYGERRVNWGNLEYDLQHGMLLQYLRTGDRRFFLRGEQAARHHIDVDVVHATNPHLKNPWGPPPQIGEIWLHALNHTGGYHDEKTSGLPVGRTYHMGHSTNFGHVWITGDLDYYYLTGDRRARTVALQMADAMVRHMPNRYGTHIRALGWPMIICLAAYDLTLDKKYLDAAAKNWQVLRKNIDWKKGWVIRLAKGHCLHDDRRCHGNVPFMEGMVCCALARYHRITGDPEVLRAITVGIDQMIRECWQDDVKTFRYTACPLSSKAPYCLFVLSAEAFAYEIEHTGNKEHLRILREGLRAAIPKGSGCSHGKALGQMTFFTPHALHLLED